MELTDAQIEALSLSDIYNYLDNYISLGIPTDLRIRLVDEIMRRDVGGS